MLKDFTYPILCTDKYVETVNFYEDFLGYVPSFECEGYVILKQDLHNLSFLAIIDKDHECIPEDYRRPVQGMFMLHSVQDIDEIYDNLYMEGIAILGDLNRVDTGDYFLIKDPNEVVIKIWQAPKDGVNLTSNYAGENFILA